MVLEGQARARVANREVALSAGDVVVLPHGDRPKARPGRRRVRCRFGGLPIVLRVGTELADRFGLGWMINLASDERPRVLGVDPLPL